MKIGVIILFGINNRLFDPAYPGPFIGQKIYFLQGVFFLIFVDPLLSSIDINRPLSSNANLKQFTIYHRGGAV